MALYLRVTLARAVPSRPSGPQRLRSSCSRWNGCGRHARAYMGHALAHVVCKFLSGHEWCLGSTQSRTGSSHFAEVCVNPERLCMYRLARVGAARRIPLRNIASRTTGTMSSDVEMRRATVSDTINVFLAKTSVASLSIFRTKKSGYALYYGMEGVGCAPAPFTVNQVTNENILVLFVSYVAVGTIFRWNRWFRSNHNSKGRLFQP
uniref:Uncharacterized protein n=1 Tax=Oryza brachyantha TaxID=4533 RepID=J3LCK3_ORYBR